MGDKRRAAQRKKRELVKARGERCEYCGTAIASADLTVDHVVRLADGGTNYWSNLRLACAKCNLIRDREVTKAEKKPCRLCGREHVSGGRVCGRCKDDERERAVGIYDIFAAAGLLRNVDCLPPRVLKASTLSLAARRRRSMTTVMRHAEMLAVIGWRLDREAAKKGVKP